MSGFGRGMGRCVVYVVFFCLVMLIDWDMWVEDVKGSNGTFINGDILSPEGLESEPYELKSDDIVVSSQFYP